MEPEPKPDPKPRGRPRVEEPRSSVSTYIRASDHDKLAALAKRHEKTISAVVRELLRLKLQ